MTNRFALCLPFTLAQEAPFPNNWSDKRNFSNDPHDPGGATMDGIIQVEYDSYRTQRGLPDQSVELISQAEGQEIYYDGYWLPRCPNLPVGLDLSFFDTSANQGQSRATKILQTALGVAADGIWGPLTEAAVQGISNVMTIINGYTVYREIAYRNTRNFNYFGTDWIRRAQEIGADSLTMLSVPEGKKAVLRVFHKMPKASLFTS